MTTNNPEVQAILVTCTDRDGETILSRGVRLIENHDPGCVNGNWNYEPLIRLSDYEALQAEYRILESELATVKKVAYRNVDLLDECKELRIALAESQANDRQAMYYLNQVRELVGGDDFPDMVERCRELVK